MSAEVSSLLSWKRALIDRSRNQDESQGSDTIVTTNCETAPSARTTTATQPADTSTNSTPAWKTAGKKYPSPSLPRPDAVTNRKVTKKETDTESEKEATRSISSRGITGVHRTMTGSSLTPPITNGCIMITGEKEEEEEERLLPIKQNPILLSDRVKRQNGHVMRDAPDITFSSSTSSQQKQQQLPSQRGSGGGQDASASAGHVSQELTTTSPNIPSMEETNNDQVFADEVEVTYGRGFVNKLLQKFISWSGKDEISPPGAPPKPPSRGRSSGEDAPTKPGRNASTERPPSSSSGKKSARNGKTQSLYEPSQKNLTVIHDDNNIVHNGDCGTAVAKQLNSAIVAGSKARANEVLREEQRSDRSSNLEEVLEQPQQNTVSTARSLFENLTNLPTVHRKKAFPHLYRNPPKTEGPRTDNTITNAKVLVAVAVNNNVVQRGAGAPSSGENVQTGRIAYPSVNSRNEAKRAMKDACQDVSIKKSNGQRQTGDGKNPKEGFTPNRSSASQQREKTIASDDTNHGVVDGYSRTSVNGGTVDGNDNATSENVCGRSGNFKYSRCGLGNGAEDPGSVNSERNVSKLRYLQEIKKTPTKDTNSQDSRQVVNPSKVDSGHILESRSISAEKKQRHAEISISRGKTSSNAAVTNVAIDDKTNDEIRDDVIIKSAKTRVTKFTACSSDFGDAQRPSRNSKLTADVEFQREVGMGTSETKKMSSTTTKPEVDRSFNVDILNSTPSRENDKDLRDAATLDDKNNVDEEEESVFSSVRTNGRVTVIQIGGAGESTIMSPGNATMENVNYERNIVRRYGNRDDVRQDERRNDTSCDVADRREVGKNDGSCSGKTTQAPKGGGGVSRPGMLLIRPASNLASSKIKTEYLDMTKYNDIKKGEFAPAKQPSGIDDDTFDDDNDDGVYYGSHGSANEPVNRYEFLGAGVNVGKSMLNKTKDGKKLKISFDEGATQTHEYPSEQSLMDSMPARPGDYDYPDDNNPTRNGNDDDDDDDDDDNDDEDAAIMKIREASSGLSSNPAISSSGLLSSYKSRISVDYEFGGAYRSDDVQQVAPPSSKSEPKLQPENDRHSDSSSWSEATTSDLLF